MVSCYCSNSIYSISNRLPFWKVMIMGGKKKKKKKKKKERHGLQNNLECKGNYRKAFKYLLTYITRGFLPVVVTPIVYGINFVGTRLLVNIESIKSGVRS